MKNSLPEDEARSESANAEKAESHSLENPKDDGGGSVNWSFAGNKVGSRNYKRLQKIHRDLEHANHAEESHNPIPAMVKDAEQLPVAEAVQEEPKEIAAEEVAVMPTADAVKEENKMEVKDTAKGQPNQQNAKPDREESNFPLAQAVKEESDKAKAKTVKEDTIQTEKSVSENTVGDSKVIPDGINSENPQHPTTGIENHPEELSASDVTTPAVQSTGLANQNHSKDPKPTATLIEETTNTNLPQAEAVQEDPDNNIGPVHNTFHLEKFGALHKH